MVYSIYDSTEVAIRKKMIIDASQRMITINSKGELGGMNPVIKKHYELQIKTLLQNAPRDVDNKLERLLRIKQRQKEEAMYTWRTYKKVG